MADPVRHVMVRDWYSVQSLPETLLQRPTGGRIKPAVERLTLIFEYWLDSGATPRRQRDEMLVALAVSGIGREDMKDLLHLLIERRHIADFVDLARQSVDADGQWRRALADRGVEPAVLRLYGAYAGLDPKSLVDGFFFGVGKSFATLVFDLATFARTVGEANLAFYGALLQIPFDSTSASTRLLAQFELVTTMAGAALRHLNPAQWPSAVQEKWARWSDDFSAALERLDSFGAGQVLGEIAGVLWQLLTAMLGVAKLLRVAGGVAAKTAPLALTSLRAKSALVAQAMREVVRLLMQIGVKVLQALPLVGMETLRLLFGRRLVDAVLREARALASFEGWSFILTPQPCLEAAGLGAMAPPLAVVASHEGRPMFMSAVSRGGSHGVRASATLTDEVIDEMVRAIDEWPDGAPKSSTPSEVVFAQRALLAQRLDAPLKAFVIEQARQLFGSLREAGEQILPWVFGTRLGQIIDGRISRLVAEFAPGVKVLAPAPGQTLTMNRLLEALAQDRLLSNTQLRSARKLLDEPIHEFLARKENRGLVQAMEKEALPAFETDAQALDYMKQYVKRRWNFKETTTLGELKPDCVLIDADLRRIDILDWTSDGSLLRFEGLIEEMSRRVRAANGGAAPPTQLDELVAAYEKLGPHDGPPLGQALSRMLRHAERETVLRNAILAKMTGVGWYTRAWEVFYENIGTLFKKVPS